MIIIAQQHASCVDFLHSHISVVEQSHFIVYFVNFLVTFMCVAHLIMLQNGGKPKEEFDQLLENINNLIPGAPAPKTTNISEETKENTVNNNNNNNTSTSPATDLTRLRRYVFPSFPFVLFVCHVCYLLFAD
jgi:hypothetical protein